MAELVYDKTGRLLFTEEMRREYTVLIPQMLPIHFKMLEKVFRMRGYNAVMLNVSWRDIVSEGLKYVHNDTCYPALLVIGQMIHTIKYGGYDPHKVALLITQTGGGCRASNYIYLLRKALARAGYEYIPIISLNVSGMEKNPGFSLDLKFIRQMLYGVIYGDIIMNLANQVRPYEIHEGQTDALIDSWVDRLVKDFEVNKHSFRRAHIREQLNSISDEFAAIPVHRTQKIKVGVVGEIYVKYSPLGNNELEAFLRAEDCEVIVPGLLDFVIFKADNRVVDHYLYGGHRFTKIAGGFIQSMCLDLQQDLIAAISRHSEFRVPCTFMHLKSLVEGYLGYGNKMGEGWLLPGEMLELIDSGVANIVCTQPFGCLPNHVAGKGMIRRIKQNIPHANIVAIDYDPGATRINQENRIKLMLANARMAMKPSAAE
ncbi:MAG: 2-hydroxyacyl-CoA dehydratase [Clostridia bacterium]|nr:2-hydroxyacyl-CoA dehydratase [Clostridia bacterium]